MEITTLCQSLSLSDEEDDIIVCDLGKEARISGEQKVANSLVGKILSTKRVSREGVITTINFLWRTKEPLVVESVGVNIFVFHFGCQEDRQRVLAGGPWTFQENLIVLEIPTGLGNHNDMKFELVSFWIQIHNLPLMCLTKEAGRSLGSQMGFVEAVDPGASGDCIGKYIRVRVKVNITKPLKRGMKVKIDDAGNVITAVLRYERLPDLCLKCGVLGHPLVECSLKTEGDGHPYKYNDLIKAGPMQGQGFKGKRVRSSVRHEIEVDETPITNRNPPIQREKRVVPIMEGGGPLTENLISTDLAPLISGVNESLVGKIQNSNKISEDKELNMADLVEIEVGKETEPRGDEILAHMKLKFKIDEPTKNGPGLKIRGKGVKKPNSRANPMRKPTPYKLGKLLPLMDITNLIEEGENSILKEKITDCKYATDNGIEKFSLQRDYINGDNFQMVVPAEQDRRNQ